jgi:HK97 gp10 family phage protein
MVIKVLNLAKCIEKFGDIKGVDLMPVIAEGTRAVQRDAKTFSPVDTGTLKNSIKTKLFTKEQTGIVFTNTEYAIYQEFGTRFMRPQAFMIPAMMANRESINRKMKDHIKSELAKKIR